MNNYAVILAAGIGSRLQPITDVMPKSLVNVAGRPILDYQISGYISSGILEENIIIVTGYMSAKIEEYVKKNYPKVRIVESVDYRITNNMFSLYMALKQIREMTNFEFNTLFINNADCLYDEKLMNEFVSSPLENAIACEMDVYIEESMKVTTTSKGNIINISKGVSPSDSFGVSVDLYKYSSDAVKALYDIIYDFIEVKKDRKQWTEVSFPLLFEKKEVYPFNIQHKKWVEVDNNDDLLAADKIFSSFKIEDKKAIICDLDGTLFIGDTPIKSAVDFVKMNLNKYNFYFLTNNTSKTPADYVHKLTKSGINVSEDKIATPLYPLIDYIKSKGLKSVFLVANNKVKSFMEQKLPDVSFEFDYEKNETVVLTYDTELTYDKLKKMSELLNNKSVEYVATHNDVFCPSEKGPIPDIGSMIFMIQKTTSRLPSIILGKPSVNLVKSYVEKYGSENIVIVGDRLYTDKLLADNALCDFICVLSGDCTRLDVALLTDSKYPAIVLQDLGKVVD